MPKVFITDEVDTAQTVDVLPGGALEVAPIYSYYLVPSGTATAQIYAGNAYLHSVNVTNTAAKGLFCVSATVSAAAVADCAGSTASAVAIADLTTRGSYIFDCYVAGGLAYRLSGIDCLGVTVSYRAA